MGIVKNRCKSGDHYWVNAYVTRSSKEPGGRLRVGAGQTHRRADPPRRRLYQRINQGKPAIPRRDKWLPVLQDWLPFILVSQVAS
jgi:aerotaxis receptor